VLNPHAIPGRMTIAHLVEMLGGKARCLQGGYANDATPFGDFSMPKLERVLHAAGYTRHGTERVRCGKTGELIDTPIYVGLVAYQRLRHMVEDKMHARAMGPHCNVTRQPVAGRVRRGGLRLGEMENWGLLAHGAAHLLYERMVTSSDGAQMLICKLCGCPARRSRGLLPQQERICSRADCRSMDFREAVVPHSFLLLANELRACGVHLRM
jgi:DNA-directed RNA polymerase beta subunit